MRGAAFALLIVAACEATPPPQPPRAPTGLSKILAKGCGTDDECDDHVEIATKKLYRCQAIEGNDCEPERADLARARNNRETFKKHQEESFDESRAVQEIHSKFDKPKVPPPSKKTAAECDAEAKKRGEEIDQTCTGTPGASKCTITCWQLAGPTDKALPECGVSKNGEWPKGCGPGPVPK